MTAAAALMIGLALAVIAGGRAAPHALRVRLALQNRSQRGRAGPTTATDVVQPLPKGVVRFTVALALVTAAAAAWAIAGPVGAIGVVAAGPAVQWLRRRRARESEMHRRSQAVAESCLVLGSELAAGASAPQAMEAAAKEWPDLYGAAAGRIGLGADPVPALREAATRPGAEAMEAVAAAWQVAEESGARAAVVLRVVADAVRDEASVRHEASAQLSTVRTTARMLAALPPITLVVFSGGVEPVWFLLRNPYGVACLAAAAALLALGLGWVSLVRREATRSAWRR